MNVVEMKSAFSQQYGWSMGEVNKCKNYFDLFLKTHGTSLNDESLCTLLIEVEAIVNSPPLTTDLLSDVTA